jgi:hypothetical protein
MTRVVPAALTGATHNCAVEAAARAWFRRVQAARCARGD